MNRLYTALCLLWLCAAPGRSAKAQDTQTATRFGLGIGVVNRGVSPEGEARLGLAAEALVRTARPDSRWQARATFDVAYFGNSADHEGRFCNPDGPCEYAAPALTLFGLGIGAEWSPPSRPFRIPIAVTTYHAYTAHIPSEIRRGKGTTTGVNVGVIVPLRTQSLHSELELRFEWLAQPIEATRYLVPVVVRITR